MTIETKYNIGDTLYTIGDDRKIAVFVVDFFGVTVTANGKFIRYYAEGREGGAYDEAYCFKSEIELKDFVFGTHS